MFKNGLLSFVLVLGEQGISSDMVPPTSIPLFHSFLEILGKGDRICQIMQEYRSFKSYGLIGQMQLYHCLSIPFFLNKRLKISILFYYFLMI